MSYFFQANQTEDYNNHKIISKSYRANKNSKYIDKNNSLHNISFKEENKTYKITYSKTETNNNNIFSNLKNEKLQEQTEPNSQKLNIINLDSSILNQFNIKKKKKKENIFGKLRVFSAHLLRNKQRLSLKNKETNIKKEAHIYLNTFVNSSISYSSKKRIKSSRGFISKADAETERIIKNKNKKRNVSYKTFHQIKNLNLIFRNNYYKYGYTTTEKNQNLNKKDIYNDLLNNNKMSKGKETPRKLKNKEDTEKYLTLIINSLTRKVQFLNSKNIILSNENTMNLLNKEEYYLYQKLKELLKNDYIIKKFSKSIFDNKNGSKYLLPLFNEINFSNSNHEQKNKKELTKIDDEFKEYKNINNPENEIKAKKIIEIFLNNNFSNKKQDSKKNNKNNICFSSDSNKQNINVDVQSQRKIKLNKSFDRKTNLQTFYQMTKNNNKNKQIVILKNSKKEPLIDKKHYQEYKMNIIKQNENLINNYHKKIIKNSTKELVSKKRIHKNSMIYNIVPIKNKVNNKFEEVKNFNEENIIKSNQNKTKSININSKHKSIKNSFSEKIPLWRNKESNKVLKTYQNNQKFSRTTKIYENDEKLNTNNKSKTEGENSKENNKVRIDSVARLSTKNFVYRNSIIKINKMANNDDIKNLLTKENNLLSDFDRIYKNNKVNIPSKNRNITFNANKIKNTMNEEGNKNKKIEKSQKNEENKENKEIISKTIEAEKKENDNLELNTITLSNNLILRESIRREDTKIVKKIERKKDKTLKLLFSYLKSYIKDIIKKEKIKKLLHKPEFKKNFDLLKSQMNQINKLSSNISSPETTKVTPLSDDDIINILYDEVKSKNEKETDSNIPKSSYVPILRTKKRKTNRKETQIKTEEKKEPEIKKNIEKENEKLELMAKEISLSNELKQHMREIFNKQFRIRLQNILDKIESYQGLNTNDYVETFKNNYSLLKEEMEQVLRDKETEDRINGFMDNLDIERNIFEAKWNFCNEKISVMDNKFEIYLGRYHSNKGQKNKI